MSILFITLQTVVEERLWKIQNQKNNWYFDVERMLIHNSMFNKACNLIINFFVFAFYLMYLIDSLNKFHYD